MDNSNCWNINNSRPKIFKQLWTLGDKHLVIIDKSIVERLGITENSTVFLEQQVMNDNNTILMRIKKF